MARNRREQHPGVVDQHIQNPEPGLDLAHRVLNRGRVSRADIQEMRVQARGFELVGSLLPARFITRSDENSEAIIARQLTRGFQSQALVGAGDKRDFVVHNRVFIRWRPLLISRLRYRVACAILFLALYR